MLLKDSFLTKTLSSKDHNTLAQAMQKQHFSKDETILMYGDIGDKYYILATGEVTVKVYEPGTSPSDPCLEDKIII